MPSPRFSDDLSVELRDYARSNARDFHIFLEQLRTLHSLRYSRPPSWTSELKVRLLQVTCLPYNGPQAEEHDGIVCPWVLCNEFSANVGLSRTLTLRWRYVPVERNVFERPLCR